MDFVIEALRRLEGVAGSVSGGWVRCQEKQKKKASLGRGDDREVFYRPNAG